MASTPSVGALIDSMYDLREAKRALESKIEDIDKVYRQHEEELMKKLDDSGLDKASGKLASASISSTNVGNVTDWETLYKYIKRTNNFQLLQRRLSDPAYRELMELKGTVPGVQPFIRKRLNLTTRKENI